MLPLLKNLSPMVYNKPQWNNVKCPPKSASWGYFESETQTDQEKQFQNLLNFCKTQPLQPTGSLALDPS